MKLRTYVLVLLLTVAVCVSILAINISKMNKHMSEQNNVLKRQLHTLEAKCSDLEFHANFTQGLLDDLNEQIQSTQNQLERKQDKTGRGGERGLIMEVTAYWEGSCGKAPDHPEYGITASGEYVQEGYIAAGKEYPIGAKLYIPYFDRTFTVMDRGGMIDNGCIDVYMRDYASCMSFGRQWLEVYEVE